MLIKLPTEKTLSQAVADLQAAARANNIGVMQVHNLRESMAEKGVAFARECMIFEVCHPQQAKEALDLDMGISTALPSRISIYEEDGGRIVLAALKPTILMLMLNAPQLNGVAREVEDTIVKIMKEAASG